jgi:small-conductance mechanosensitive channel
MGIIFGFFPAWWSRTAVIIKAVMDKRKGIPKWLNDNAWPNPYTTKLIIRFMPDKFYPIFYRMLPVVWVVACLSGFVYLARIDIIKGIPFEKLLVEATLPVFLILTWLLPPYFLRRYIRNLKTDDMTADK